MKVAAHPVLVAVALGLLGPNALADDVEEAGAPSEPTPCVGCTCGLATGSLSEAEDVKGAGSIGRLRIEGEVLTSDGCERLRSPEDVALDEAVARLWSALTV